jgi:hypothetical protein
MRKGFQPQRARRYTRVNRISSRGLDASCASVKLHDRMLTYLADAVGGQLYSAPRIEACVQPTF